MANNPYAVAPKAKQQLTTERTRTRIASMLLSVMALAMFILALFLPAASLQVDWLDRPAANNVVSGWALFKASFLILMPVAIPFCMANVLLILSSVALPWCYSLHALLLRSFLLVGALMLGFFESVTTDHLSGHHLWVASFLVAIVAHIAAIADICRTRKKQPGTHDVQAAGSSDSDLDRSDEVTANVSPFQASRR
ncbi:MAG: hypothetical protein R3C49_22255 [Planctomycetaceae bacterium]